MSRIKQSTEPGLTGQPTFKHPGSAAKRIIQVENSLVHIDENNNPLWGSTSSLSERMNFYQVPGVSLAVIDNFKLAWVKGYGERSAGSGDPVTTQTLFHAGSVAKSVSAAAVLELVDQGLLHLDEDVNKTLSSWHVPESKYTRRSAVTIRRLLSHSAGIKDGLTDRGPDDPMPMYITFGDELPRVSLQQLLAGISEDDIEPARVVNLPGKSYRYTNADFTILEILVEDRLGQPFEDFMQTAVLDPLQMQFSSYHQPLPPHLRSITACEHTLDGKPIKGGRANFPFHAAGSLWTTPEDLAIFMIDLMKSYKGSKDHLLSPQMAIEMLSPQIEIQDSPLIDASGLGLMLKGANQGLQACHPGGTFGSCSLIWFYPNLGTGAVVMVNNVSGSILRFEILLSIASVYGWPTN